MGLTLRAVSWQQQTCSLLRPGQAMMDSCYRADRRRRSKWPARDVLEDAGEAGPAALESLEEDGREQSLSGG